MTDTIPQLLDEVMLKSDANQTTPKIANLFRKWGIKLHSVDWDVPPDMKHYPKTAAGQHSSIACYEGPGTIVICKRAGGRYQGVGYTFFFSFDNFSKF